jgi:hypothetical protein
MQALKAALLAGSACRESSAEDGRVGFRCGNMVTGEALEVDYLAVSGHRLACVFWLQPGGLACQRP